jgi:hypothetical protein
MRRALSWLATLIVSLAALVGLITLINSRDKSGIDQGTQTTTAASAPGSPYRSLAGISPELRRALRRGNVLVLYRAPRPSAAVQQLVPPGGKQLEQAGQAVILDHQPRLNVPLAAVSAKRIQTARTPEELQPFIDYWLGGH